MDTTSLTKLKETGCTICNQNGLTVRIPHSWIVTGEDRVSYTTLIRLVECCREHHWYIDILPLTNDIPLDSILKSIKGNFINSILVNTAITITYNVNEVRSKGYSLRFTVRGAEDQTLYAHIELVSVFYDPLARKSVIPPKSVLDRLYILQNKACQVKV